MFVKMIANCNKRYNPVRDKIHYHRRCRKTTELHGFCSTVAKYSLDSTYRFSHPFNKHSSCAFWCTLYNCLHGTAPRYLQDVIQPVAEVTSRRRLRSASSSTLVVPATRRSSLRDRAFAVAGPRAWNSLPEFVTDCSSPLTFKNYLKTYLFSLSF